MSFISYKADRYANIRIYSNNDYELDYSSYELTREGKSCWFIIVNDDTDYNQEFHWIPYAFYRVAAFRIAMLNLEKDDGYVGNNSMVSGRMTGIVVDDINGHRTLVSAFLYKGKYDFPTGKNVRKYFDFIDHSIRGDLATYGIKDVYNRYKYTKHTYYELRATVGRFLYKLKNTNQNGCCF